MRDEGNGREMGGKRERDEGNGRGGYQDLVKAPGYEVLVELVLNVIAEGAQGSNLFRHNHHHGLGLFQ